MPDLRPEAGGVVHLLPVAQLMEGCRYCGTRFRMKDLFPRVVNTYFIRTTSIMKHTTNQRRIMGILMLVMLLVSMPGAMISGEGVIPIALFTAYLTALICGGVGGFVITSIMMSCTETIFYTMSVYFIAAKVTKTRYTLAGAMLSTVVGIVASVILAGMIV